MKQILRLRHVEYVNVKLKRPGKVTFCDDDIVLPGLLAAVHDQLAPGATPPGPPRLLLVVPVIMSLAFCHGATDY
ncbi:hypothetical protein FRC12_015776 [Ceratobasidium sp. 428]|nr:hypothetical protein FRC12_015776 [Ceratobasidium sp. 428]